MNHLTYGDIVEFLTDLLSTRRAQLEAIGVAKPYAETLDQTLAELRALPPQHFGGKPKAEELASTDGRHDGFGTALYFLGQAYLALPTASPKAKECARLIVDSYVPGRNHLRASYATEASRANGRQRRLPDDAEVLNRLPVEGGTAQSWVSGYVEAGVELGMLLSLRADATGNRSQAGVLRGQAITDVLVLRELIARALRRTPDGGREVDHDLFGYLDTLAEMRDSGSEDPTPPPPPPKPAG